MTFLELVKALASETGVELESKITSVSVPPESAYGGTTEHRSRLVRWIQRSWRDIQNDQPRWKFMIRNGQMALVKNQWTYDIKGIVDGDLPVGFEDYQYEEIIPFVAPRDARYVWIVDGGVPIPRREPCYYVPPERFFGHIDRFNDKNVGTPSRYTFDREGWIVFDSKPADDNLYLQFEYRVVQQELTADADVPRGLPEKFHELIVYGAMMKNSMFDESDPQYRRARTLYRDMMNKLRLEEMPDYSMTGTYT